MAGLPRKGMKHGDYHKAGIIQCGLRPIWNERRDEIPAMGRFMKFLWPLREWRIPHKLE